MLDGGAPVALDEDEDDVLAAQCGQQLVAWDVAVGVDSGLRGERLPPQQAGAYLPRVVVGKARRAAGGDRHVRDDLGAEHGAGDPGGREPHDRAGRGGPAPGHEPGQAQHRQRHENEHRDGENCGDDHGADRAGPADRGREELLGAVQQDPVEHRVERAGEDREESHVEDLHDGQQTQSHPGERRDHPPRPRRQDEQEGHAEDSLDRDARERTRCEATDLVRRDECGKHQEAGQRGDRPRRDRVPSAPVVPSRHTVVGWPVRRWGVLSRRLVNPQQPANPR
jgi:hypothetical protein